MNWLCFSVFFFFFFFPIFSRIPSILSESFLGVRSLSSTSICQCWSPNAMGVDSGSPGGPSGWRFNSTGSCMLEVVESSLLEGRDYLLNMDSIQFLGVRLTILWKGRSLTAWVPQVSCIITPWSCGCLPEGQVWNPVESLSCLLGLRLNRKWNRS